MQHHHHKTTSAPPRDPHQCWQQRCEVVGADVAWLIETVMRRLEVPPHDVRRNTAEEADTLQFASDCVRIMSRNKPSPETWKE